MKEQKEKRKSTAVALGFFDGVHLGHKEVINSMLKTAQEDNLTSLVYTFKDNPLAAFGKSVPFITTNKERASLLKGMGVDLVVEDDFLNIKDLSPEEFVKNILVNRFSAKKVFCGFNYHFGKGGKGDSKILQKLCNKYGIDVFVIAPVIVKDAPVSSTRIRNLLQKGSIEEANFLLDHKFGFSSIIEEGNHIGRLMETPTINQSLPDNMILPAFGVYTTGVTIDKKLYVGVTNIGVKPTVGEYAPLSETWLPKYVGGNLYGKKIDVRLLCFHRPERKFDTFEELEAAIKKDGKLAVENFKRFASE
jgi:riboflavin kinase/FMN adenylyltransferase